MLTKEAREARRLYQREWRRRNPDKCRAYAAAYWQKRAQIQEGKDEANQAKI